MASGILILSTLAPELRPLVKQVYARYPGAVVWHCYWQRPPDAPRPLQQLLRHPLRTLRRQLRSAWTSNGSRREGSRIAQRLLPPGSTEGPAVPIADSLPMHVVSGPAFAARLRALAPDVLLLLGAPRVAADALDIPPLGTWNLHLGLAPEFRGEDTCFHAWRLGRFDALGVTLHRAEAALDQGPIAVQAWPELGPDHTLEGVLADLLRLSTNLVLRLLEALGEGPVPTRLQGASSARTWKRADRTRVREAWFWLRRRLGGLRPPVRPQRVEWVAPAPAVTASRCEAMPGP